jgi:predicted esterase
MAASLVTIAACGDDAASHSDAGASSDDDAGGVGGGDSGASDPDAGSEGARPDSKFLPEASGSCPGFREGDGCKDDGTSLVCTFEPDGVPPRKARVWLGDGAREGGGALVFFWHGLSRDAADAILPAAGLGPAVRDDIVASGGVLVGVEKEEGRMTGFTSLPWIAGLGGTGEGENMDDDFLVMDEIVACAIEELAIDLRRIHSTGISAGGLQTGQVVARRSGYLASAVVFSGGIFGSPMIQEPTNKLPVMIVWGGMNDMVVLNFEQTSLDMRKRLDANGQFSVLCDHGMGHIVPVEAAKAGWRFLQDHPYGTVPSPYENGLPDAFPAYCSLDAPMP